MAFGLMLRKVSKSETQERVQEAARSLDLSECLETQARRDFWRATTAGGPGPRAGAATENFCCSMSPCPISIPSFAPRLRGVIAKLHRTLSCTMILCHHDQTEAMMLGTKLAVMKDGVIQQSGEPLALYRHPRNLFVAGFIGWPAMNLIPGSLAAQGPEL